MGKCYRDGFPHKFSDTTALYTDDIGNWDSDGDVAEMRSSPFRGATRPLTRDIWWNVGCDRNVRSMGSDVFWCHCGFNGKILAVGMYGNVRRYWKTCFIRASFRAINYDGAIDWLAPP